MWKCDFRTTIMRHFNQSVKLHNTNTCLWHWQNLSHQCSYDWLITPLWLLFQRYSLSDIIFLKTPFYQLLVLKVFELPWHPMPLRIPLTWSSYIFWFLFFCNDQFVGFFSNLNLFRLFEEREHPSLPKKKHQMYKTLHIPCVPRKFVQSVQSFRFSKQRAETGAVCWMTSVSILGFFFSKEWVSDDNKSSELLNYL